MSKYENSAFPYSLHSTLNLPAWRPKDTNVTLMSVHLVFFQNDMTNVVKIDEIREELSTSHFVM